MTFLEKYPQLQNKELLAQLLTETVFGTMALEAQQVPEHKVAAIVEELLAGEVSKLLKFQKQKIS